MISMSPEKYKEIQLRIKTLSVIAALFAVTGLSIGLLALNYVLIWENISTQFFFWASWVGVVIALMLRHMLKKL